MGVAMRVRLSDIICKMCFTHIANTYNNNEMLFIYVCIKPRVLQDSWSGTLHKSASFSCIQENLSGCRVTEITLNVLSSTNVCLFVLVTVLWWHTPNWTVSCQCVMAAPLFNVSSIVWHHRPHQTVNCIVDQDHAFSSTSECVVSCPD